MIYSVQSSLFRGFLSDLQKSMALSPAVVKAVTRELHKDKVHTIWKARSVVQMVYVVDFRDYDDSDKFWLAVESLVKMLHETTAQLYILLVSMPQSSKTEKQRNSKIKNIVAQCESIKKDLGIRTSLVILSDQVVVFYSVYVNAISPAAPDADLILGVNYSMDKKVLGRAKDLCTPSRPEPQPISEDSISEHILKESDALCEVALGAISFSDLEPETELFMFEGAGKTCRTAVVLYYVRLHSGCSLDQLEMAFLEHCRSTQLRFAEVLNCDQLVFIVSHYGRKPAAPTWFVDFSRLPVKHVEVYFVYDVTLSVFRRSSLQVIVA